MVAARALSIEAFGLFSLASTLGWILAVATDFGLTIHAAREIAQAPASVSAILRPILRLRLTLALAGAALALAGLAFVVPFASVAACAAIVCAYLASALVEFLNYVYRAVARSEIESTLNLIMRLATLALAVAGLQAFPSLTTLAIAMLVPPLVMLVVSLRVVARIAPTGVAAPAPASFSRATFFRDVFPLGLGVALSALYFRVDLFLIEYWRGLADVASYNAVFRLVEALRLFPGAILTVLLPTVFGRPTGGFVLRMSFGLGILGIVITAVALEFVPAILEIAYGDRYAAAAAMPFRVLLLAFPLLALNYGLTHAVIGWRGQKAFAIGCGAALIANVAMNMALIPAFGITGAAVATLATEALLTIFWLYVLIRSRRTREARGALSPAN